MNHDLAFLDRYKAIRQKFYPPPPPPAIPEPEPEPEPEPVVEEHGPVFDMTPFIKGHAIALPNFLGGAEEEVVAYTRTPVWEAKAIFAQVVRQTGVGRNDIISQRRTQIVVDARQYLMWRLRRETTWSLPEIGRFLGGRDHTTVLHGTRKYQRWIDQEKAPWLPPKGSSGSRRTTPPSASPSSTSAA